MGWEFYSHQDISKLKWLVISDETYHSKYLEASKAACWAQQDEHFKVFWKVKNSTQSPEESFWELSDLKTGDLFYLENFLKGDDLRKSFLFPI